MIAPRKSSAMLERARQSTQDGREQAARELLEWEKVEGAIREAAGKGFEQVTLIPAIPVDIKNTDQAQATERKLQHLGFSTRWDERAGPEQGTRLYALIVGWSGS